MKVIIAGSRTITDKVFVNRCIEDTILKIHLERFSRIKTASYEELKREVMEGVKIITDVISGGARGIDKLGEEWARKNEIKISYFPANWEKYGKKAGYLRNVEMANYAECLIAIWEGNSRGTKHMIDIATKKGLKIFVYKV